MRYPHGGELKRVAIVQARMTSTRLPGKVLQKLAGRSVLWHVLTRCAKIPGIEKVCCAVPEGSEHDAVADAARTCDIEVMRGPEFDVLDRYHKAAMHLKADIVVRVTSDCPLIDPAVCGQVLAALEDGKAADYAANNFTHRFPHGLDCEAFTIEALDMAWRHAETAHEREHVTPWVRNSSVLRHAAVVGPSADYGAERWTLDYPEDLEFLRALFQLFPTECPHWQEVAAIVRSHPELRALNAEHVQR